MVSEVILGEERLTVENVGVGPTVGSLPEVGLGGVPEEVDEEGRRAPEREETLSVVVDVGRRPSEETMVSGAGVREDVSVVWVRVGVVDVGSLVPALLPGRCEPLLRRGEWDFPEPTDE